MSQRLGIVTAVIFSIFVIGAARPALATDYIGTNTELYGDDVALGPFPVGFTFTYFGNSYTQFYPSTNGLLSFGQGYSTYSNTGFPNAGVANSIAPFWDDIITEGFEKKTILYRTIGTAPNRRLVVQWTNMFFFSNPSLPMGTFQAVLFEGSNRIQFQYRLLLGGSVSQGSSATIGLDDSTGSSCSLQYSYNSAVLSEGQVLAFDPSDCGYSSVTGTFEDAYLIDALAPATPTLATPAQGATGVAAAPTLTWNAASNALSYRLLVASDAGFANIVSDQPGLTSTSTSVSGLSLNTTYYWRVSATNDAGTAFSDSWSFTTGAAVNHPPTTGDDSYATNQDLALSVSAPGVLGNDVDLDENPLTAALVSGPAHGSLTFNANGSFTYTPSSGFNGVDSFAYAANDGSAGGNVASVSLSVNPLVSIADSSGGEALESITFAVTLSGPAVQAVTVAYATSNGSATSGADYVATLRRPQLPHRRLEPDRHDSDPGRLLERGRRDLLGRPLLSGEHGPRPCRGRCNDRGRRPSPIRVHRRRHDGRGERWNVQRFLRPHPLGGLRARRVRFLGYGRRHGLRRLRLRRVLRHCDLPGGHNQPDRIGSGGSATLPMSPMSPSASSSPTRSTRPSTGAPQSRSS